MSSIRNVNDEPALVQITSVPSHSHPSLPLPTPRCNPAHTSHLRHLRFLKGGQDRHPEWDRTASTSQILSHLGFQ